MSEPAVVESEAGDQPPEDQRSEDQRFLEKVRDGWLSLAPSHYWLMRFCFFRALGAIYFVAFLSLSQQLRPLIGQNGLLPAAAFLDRVHADLGSGSYFLLPTLFWLGHSDALLQAASWLGVGLSLGVVAGLGNSLVFAALWAVYLSFIKIGQVFYGYGWEMMLAEVGFLAIFLAPLRDSSPFSPTPPPTALIWMLRWMLFRVMFGAGLIKIRGDECWSNLTCLFFHYETQPVPNPLSWYLHQLPGWFHRAEVLFNHLVELVAPWGVFGPRRVRHTAGGFIVAFQLLLILSGNLSFLNWLTMVIALGCFDDSLYGRLLPESLCQRFERAERGASVTKARRITVGVLTFIVAVLSLNPVVNMLSPRQAMNASFEPLGLVNTYGAFGSIERERREVILEGTTDPFLSAETRWFAYELPCKPGDIYRRPCVRAPYHYRLDWQMWFAGISGNYRYEPWIVHLVYKLLRGNHEVDRLFAYNPFPKRPPRFVRARYYRYHFTRLGDKSGAWWRRELIGDYLRPLSLDNLDFQVFLADRGWWKGLPNQ